MVSCPVFVGQTDGFRARGGPHILPNRSEILFGGWNSGPSPTMYRTPYPPTGTLIESFTLAADADSTCLSNTGTLWWMTRSGDFYRRANPTSAGTDVNLGNLGPADAWRVAWSPSTLTVFAIRHDSGFSPQIWEINPADDSATLRRTASFTWTGLSSPDAVGTTDGSLWFAWEAELHRYDTATTLIDASSLTVAWSHLAATNTGLCIAQTSRVEYAAELVTVGPSWTSTVLACDALTGAGVVQYGELNNGVMDPTGAAFAVMSHFTNNAATGDEIWAWGGRKWRVGSVGVYA